MRAWSRLLPPSDTSNLDRLSLPAVRESIALFREFILDRAYGLPPAVVMKIDLAVEELLLNVFNYAYDPGAKGSVEVSCGTVPGLGFLLRVSDQGKAFDPLAHHPPDLDVGLEERTEGGLGILLVREMSLSQTYHREGDRNVLEIVFETT
jgi:serine/threonine-protein kinase RsbW